MRIKALLASVAILGLAGGASATDWGVSETSADETFSITAVIPPLVAVSGLDDMNIDLNADALNNPWFSRIDASQTFCVYSNIGADGDYMIDVQGSEPAPSGSPFGLTGTGGERLGFGVWLFDSADRTGDNNWRYAFNGVQYNHKAGSGPNARPSLPTCPNGENAEILVGFDDEDVLAVQADTYTGNLTVTVSVI